MSDVINVIYRLSDNGYNKPKFPNATKMHCLHNCVKQFKADNIHLFVDETNLLPETREAIQLLDEVVPFENFQYYVGGSSAGSWRHVYNYATKTLGHRSDDTIFYFVEDDYLHLPRSAQILLEGLAIADYVSLYDHNDKYIPGTKGGNPFIGIDAGETTKVYRTKSTHWKLTNSTTMTFATTLGQLKEDDAIWQKYTQGTHPNDFQCFLELRAVGRSLITPIPGYSTHCEPKWASPGIDWETV